MENNEQQHHHSQHHHSEHTHSTHSHSSSSGSSSSHHHSHSGRHKSSSKKNVSSMSKFKKQIQWLVLINGILLLGSTYVGISFKSFSLLTGAALSVFNVLLLALSYYSLKLKSIPSYEYKSVNYKLISIKLLVPGLVFILMFIGAMFVSAILVLRGYYRVVEFPVFIMALVGVCINVFKFFVLKKQQDQTLATRMAYEGSACGILVYTFSFLAASAALLENSLKNAAAVATLLAVALVCAFAIRLLYFYIRRGFHILPDGVEIEQIISVFKLNEQIKSYRHLNVWTNNAEEVELSVHLALSDITQADTIKRKVKDELRKMGIEVVTLAFKQYKEE